MKKKILITAYNFDIGGIERALLTLLKNIDYKKNEVVVALEKKEGIFLNELPKEVILEEVKVYEHKMFLLHKAKNYLSKKGFFKKYSSNYFDLGIVYAPYSLSGNKLVRKTCQKKKIYIHTDYLKYYDNSKKQAKEFFDNLFLDLFDKIIFVSNEARENFQNLFPQYNKKIETINNLIDYKRIQALSKEIIVNKPKDKTILLFVGRLEEKEKKFSRQIKLIEELNHQNIPVELWVVGDGKDKKEYEEEVKRKKLTNIIFLSKQKNPYPFMKACDYLLLTSDFEGFPVIYNEALVLNKQIITTIDVSDDLYQAKDLFWIVNKDSNDKTIEIIAKKLIKKQKLYNFKKENIKRLNEIIL